MSVPKQLYFGSIEDLHKSGDSVVEINKGKTRVRIMEPGVSTLPKSPSMSPTMQNNVAPAYSSSSLDRRKNVGNLQVKN